MHQLDSRRKACIASLGWIDHNGTERVIPLREYSVRARRDLLTELETPLPPPASSSSPPPPLPAVELRRVDICVSPVCYERQLVIEIKYHACLYRFLFHRISGRPVMRQRCQCVPGECRLHDALRVHRLFSIPPLLARMMSTFCVVSAGGGASDATLVDRITNSTDTAEVQCDRLRDLLSAIVARHLHEIVGVGPHPPAHPLWEYTIDHAVLRAGELLAPPSSRRRHRRAPAALSAKSVEAGITAHLMSALGKRGGMTEPRRPSGDDSSRVAVWSYPEHTRFTSWVEPLERARASPFRQDAPFFARFAEASFGTDETTAPPLRLATEGWRFARPDAVAEYLGGERTNAIGVAPRKTTNLDDALVRASKYCARHLGRGTGGGVAYGAMDQHLDDDAEAPADGRRRDVVRAEREWNSFRRRLYAPTVPSVEWELSPPTCVLVRVDRGRRTLECSYWNPTWLNAIRGYVDGGNSSSFAPDAQETYALDPVHALPALASQFVHTHALSKHRFGTIKFETSEEGGEWRPVGWLRFVEQRHRTLPDVTEWIHNGMEGDDRGAPPIVVSGDVAVVGSSERGLPPFVSSDASRVMAISYSLSGTAQFDHIFLMGGLDTGAGKPSDPIHHVDTLSRLALKLKRSRSALLWVRVESSDDVRSLVTAATLIGIADVLRIEILERDRHHYLRIPISR